MYPAISHTIETLQQTHVLNEERKAALQPLIDFVQNKVQANRPVHLNFICTHNSRRSHLAQIWAQAAGAYFNIPHVYCYSGGTEVTAMHPQVIETLRNQGFRIFSISAGANPVYAIKFDDNRAPVIGFSKQYENPFNPVSEFAAVMTCSQADSGCPFIAGAEKRIPITFEDPGISDNTPQQTEIYRERSLDIAAEMGYVFSMIQSKQ